MTPPVKAEPGVGQYATLDNLLEGCQVIGFDWRYLYVNDAAASHGRKPRGQLVGRLITECYPGIDRTPTFTALRRSMEERLTAHIENEFTYDDGSSAWFELRIEPVPEGLFVLSLDITGRKQAERDMRRQIERLRSLRAIDLAILGSTDYRVALATVVEQTAKRLAVDAAVVLLLGPNLTTLEVAASTGFRTPAADRLSVGLGEGAAGKAALERQPVVVRDLALDEAAREDVPAALLEEGILAFCAVPLVAKSHLIGVLAVVHRAPLDADQEWLEFLEALAGQAAMAIDAGRSYEDLQRAHLEMALAYERTIEGWGKALDLRDRQTSDHTMRVAKLTVELARAAGMSDEQIVQVRRGALLHDIGKMAIPDAILFKRGALTDEEQAVMKRHPDHAFRLLSPIGYLRPALDIPYCHHERWDGTGYPRGLRGEAIPLAARLFAVVDVWDALGTERPYHERWSNERVLEHLRSLAGTHLDPTAVELFVGMMTSREAPADFQL